MKRLKSVFCHVKFMGLFSVQDAAVNTAEILYYTVCLLVLLDAFTRKTIYIG